MNHTWSPPRNRRTRPHYGLIFGLLLLASTPGPVFAQTPPCPDSPPVTISPQPPSDVCVPRDFGGIPIAFFDDFSWRSFVALNWPAITGDTRGEPDIAKKVGDGGARVWETWKTDYETFLKGGQKPLEWNSFDAATPCEVSPNTNGEMKRRTPATMVA